MGEPEGHFCPTCLVYYARGQRGGAEPACPRCGRLPLPESVPARSRRPSADGTQPAAAVGLAALALTPPALPRALGPYAIEEELGRGGMGIVYRARPRGGGPPVAVKRLRDGAAAGRVERERFLREARLAGRLRHPGIVPVLDAGEDGPELFLVMPLVCGEGLDERLAAGPIPPAEAAALVAAAARAIAHAHDEGVVHRDLKPANILLDPDGGPRVTDFGLARPRDPSARLTASGELVGTPAYTAPEILAGSAPSPASDLYALGAILYECLTGSPPHGHGSFLDLTARILNDDPAPPRRLRPEIPAALEAVCLKSLDRRPRRRYADAAGLAEDLDRFARGEAVAARLPGPATRLARRLRRRPAAVSLAAAAIAVAAAIAGVLVRPRQAPPAASCALRTDPPGAAVALTHVGGTALAAPMALGDTPFDGAPIPAGDLRLRVQAPACATLCLPLTAQPGEAVARSLQLVPAKDVPPGMAVVVPAGGFASAPNSPAKPFLIDRCEVTNDEFKRFCDATGARTPRHWKRRRIPEGKEGHPVVNVAASDAEAYAAWAGKRLPTAAEWRAAAQGADGRRYPWGNAFDPARLNSRSHGVGGSLPPGRLAAGESPYGVLDLAGNVAEWISCAPLKDAAVRLVAGGHYDSPPEDCTTSSFKSHQAEKPEMWIGFRCARDVP